MPNRRTPPMELVLPTGGVVTGTAHGDQPPGTMPDALNVRAWESRDRLGLGKRAGTVKAVTDQAGTTSSRRIVGLSVLNEAQGVPSFGNSTELAVNEDWSGAATGDPSPLGNNWVPVYFNQTGALFESAQWSIDGSNNLLLDASGGTSFSFILMPHSRFIKNEDGVTLDLNATRSCVTTNDGNSSTGPINIGPFIGANIGLGTGIYACFRVTAANTMQAKIFEWNGLIMTEKATSGNLVLAGTATLSDYRITLSKDDVGLVTAVFSATGVLTAGADIAETLTYTSALTGARGGFCTYPRTAGATIVNWRTVTNVAFTSLVPLPDTVFATVDPDAANPVDSNRYYLPSGWRGVNRATGGSLTLSDDGVTSGVDLDFPRIDDTNNNIEAVNAGTGNSAFADQVRFAVYQTVGAGYGVKIEVDLDNATNAYDVGTPVFRASADGRNALVLFIRPNYSSSTDLWGIRNIHGVALVDNVATNLGAVYNDTPAQALFVASGNNALRWTDDGTTIRCYLNGMLVYSFEPASAFSGWTADIGTALANYDGVGFTSGMPTTNNSALTGNIGKVQIVQGENAETAVDITDFKPKVLVLTEGRAAIADLEDDTLSAVSGGTGITKALPQAVSFNKKFYVVDGEVERIIDPAALTVTDWVTQVSGSGLGTLPTNCQLIALYRGRIVLARQDTNPTVWYMSRVFNPLDWDFNAEPLETAPYAGTNATVGVPGDAIVALIPFADDYLIFGSPATMWIMEGDPGFGGSIQLMTNESGILGPRAWCFDDQGTLYYMGSSGLYRLPRGQFQPENVSGRKISSALDRINSGNTLVQLAWDSFRQHVYIFLTPTTAGQIGTNYCFDPATDSYWPLKYPLDHGPWSVANLKGNTDELRQFVMGGNTGYLYRPSESDPSDDGTAIETYARLGPVEMDRGLQEALLTELRFQGAASNGALTWEIYDAQTATELADIDITTATPTSTGTIFGNNQGWQQSARTRARNGAIQLVLRQTSSTVGWNMERIQAFFGPVGNRRP